MAVSRSMADCHFCEYRKVVKIISRTLHERWINAVFILHTIIKTANTERKYKKPGLYRSVLFKLSYVSVLSKFDKDRYYKSDNSYDSIEFTLLFRKLFPGACLKIHSRDLHSPLCGIFTPHSVNVARYVSLIWGKSPTNW